MKKDKIIKGTLRDLAEASGVNYELMVLKCQIVDVIRAHCKKHKISQRKLASMVPGLSQDRVSDMYNGFGAGITVDKLFVVAQTLKIKVTITAEAA